MFQDVQAGLIEFPAALRLVNQARRRASRVWVLLRKLGDTDEHRSLNERFRKAQTRMESGAIEEGEGDLFAELTQAVHSLQLLAHDAFYTRPSAE